VSCYASDESVEVIGVPGRELAAVFYADRGLGPAEEIQGHVLDGGHVFRAVAGPQPGGIVAEDDVEHPVQAVLDLPVGARTARAKVSAPSLAAAR
jgi:hypothetical protein